MLFLAYWELNSDKDIREVAKLAGELTKSGKWPAKGVKIHVYTITPSIPQWGVTIVEGESEEQLFNNLLAWITAKPGIFKTYEIAPALPVEKAIPLAFKY